MPDPRQLDDYIAAHTSAEPPLLHDLWRHTNLTRLYPRMCTGHVQGRLLTMLAAMARPRRILELGTFSGYSALCLAMGAPGAEVHTIEIDDEAEPAIRQWLDRAPEGRRITLHIGDALDIIPHLPGGWDMVYIDANKRHYVEYLDLLLPRLSPGAFILADNTLWGGKVADPGALAHDAQARGLAAFNDRVAADPRLETVILPLRDGLSIIRVLPAQEAQL